MKKVVIFAVFVIVFGCFTVTSYAAESSVEDIFPEDTQQLLNENGFTDLDIDALLNLSPSQVTSYIINAVKNEINAPFILFYIIFLVIIITSIASGINGGFLSAELDKGFSAVAVLSVCTTAIVPIIACIEEIRQFITQMSSFVKVFVPVLSGVMIGGGQVNSGAGYQLVMIFAAEFLSTFLSGIILPLILMYLALATVSRITAGFKIDSITNSVKSVVNWSLSLLMGAFVGLITIKGLIGTGSDSLALRTGKFFVGNFVPAVGGALAEAASTVQKSVGLIKNTTGVFGIIAAAIYFIPPFIKILIYKFTCDLSSTIGDMLGAEKLAGLLKDISAVLGLLTSVILSYGVLVILSTAVTLIIGKGG